ncbi:MAG: 2,3-bisphosphoglycerate-independent phosphoglycerate mutase [Planctomycetes bacterium]|nr:2,3-bisphosphoglycerate-independent phosphoglycerate mutase [Planctomycetota bacterium]
MTRRRAVLVILDGWGIHPRREANAIELARTPIWHDLVARYPTTELDASGEAVGQRPGVMGNSEVGHLNIGAGRLVGQDITRIDRSIADGSFFRNPALVEAFEAARRNHGRVHLMGLVSDGAVHSAESHYQALIEMARRREAPIAFHAFLDGRDSPNHSGAGFLRRLGVIPSTVMGRYWAMDRDKRWERTERGWRAIALGEGRREEDPAGAVEAGYARSEFDEFVAPMVHPGYVPLADGDAVIHFNFRADRVRELARALTEPEFSEFARPRFPRVGFTGMVRYHESWTHLPCAFEPLRMKNLLGQVIADHGLKQLRVAETEKYAHVTFFFNGGSDAPYPGEERILVPSPKVATYDLKPEMSCAEVTDHVVRAIGADVYGLIVVNLANGDMVGHTGVLEAAIRACEAVDEALGRMRDAARSKGVPLLITADHGNCEEMIDARTGRPHTYHTTNPVPFVLVDETRVGAALRRGGSFRDIAPTLLHLLDLPAPPDMTGHSLLQ